MSDTNDSKEFHVDQIDHVELCVPNRESAAAWYRDVLGMDVIPEFAHWAEDPRGPLMIGTKQGNAKLALFQGGPTGSQRSIGFHLVAFRVGATSFAHFVASLANLNLTDEHGRIVDSAMVSDHGKAYSVYFCDPWGHQLELTTYDYEATKQALNRQNESSSG